MLAALLAAFVGSCQSSTDMEQLPSSATKSNAKEAFKSQFEAEKSASSTRHAVIQEILKGDRNYFIRLNARGEDYWIVTKVEGLAVGQHIDHSDATAKHGYYSESLNKTFETIYLVSKIAVAHSGSTDPHGSGASTPPSDAVSIAYVIENAASLNGKEVVVSGTVVKVNAHIMDRNWMHLKDGSADDYDFVITTNDMVPAGHNAAFRGTVTVNKDFGAGYTYALIIENATAL